jgi:hypothetical protein
MKSFMNSRDQFRLARFGQGYNRSELKELTIFVSCIQEWGNSALSLAAAGGYESIVSALLEAPEINIDYRREVGTNHYRRYRE